MIVSRVSTLIDCKSVKIRKLVERVKDYCDSLNILEVSMDLSKLSDKELNVLVEKDLGGRVGILIREEVERRSKDSIVDNTKELIPQQKARKTKSSGVLKQ